MTECGCKFKVVEAVKFLDVARANRRAKPLCAVASGCLRDALEDLEAAAREFAACQLCGITHAEDCDMGVDCKCQPG